MQRDYCSIQYSEYEMQFFNVNKTSFYLKTCWTINAKL